MHTLLMVMGNELTAHYYAQLGEASQREFRLRLPTKPELGTRRYFLLVEAETEKLLASGYLRPVYPVFCSQETFSFLNIGDIIAEEKGKGYGKQVVRAISEHLIADDSIGLGFCAPNNKGFYENCGLIVETTSTHRFIYRDGEHRYTAGDQFILYQDSSDRFMKHVLAQSEHEVFVPDPTIW